MSGSLWRAIRRRVCFQTARDGTACFTSSAAKDITVFIVMTLSGTDRVWTPVRGSSQRNPKRGKTGGVSGDQKTDLTRVARSQQNRQERNWKSAHANRRLGNAKQDFAERSL